MGVLLEPFPQIGRGRTRLARATGVRALENRDVVRHEALRPLVPLGIRDARPVVGSDVEIVVLRPARRRKVGVAYPTVAAHGHRVRPRKPLLRCGPRHPAETASQLVGQSLRHRVGQRQPAEQRMDGQWLPSARQCNCTVEHLLGVHVGGQRLEFGYQPLHFTQQPGPVRRNPAQGNTRSRRGRERGVRVPTAHSIGTRQAAPSMANIEVQHRMSGFYASSRARATGTERGRSRALHSS